MLGWLSAEAARASRRKRSERLWVFSYVVRQEFQSDEATEFGVLRLVNDTHPTAAELFHDAIVGDRLADHLQECYGVGLGMSMHGFYLQLRVLRLGLFQDGDVGVGVFPEEILITVPYCLDS